jgi:hypothetical protein
MERRLPRPAWTVVLAWLAALLVLTHAYLYRFAVGM